MDIEKLLTAGEWLEVPGVAGYKDFGSFRLKITLTDPLEHYEFLSGIEKTQPDTKTVDEAVAQAKELANRILALVVGWDFDSNGEVVACTPENKSLYLRRLLFQIVLKEDGTPDGVNLARRILDFSGNIESALKN
jgi:hypothetical protein